MANEAELVLETELPVNMVVADGTGIEKGSVCQLSGDLTASLTSGDNDIIAGITNGEKIASSGVTMAGIYRGGWFRMYISGTVTRGDPVGSAGSEFPNYVYSVANIANLSSTKVLGFALESGTAGQQKIIELRPSLGM